MHPRHMHSLTDVGRALVTLRIGSPSLTAVNGASGADPVDDPPWAWHLEKLRTIGGSQTIRYTYTLCPDHPDEISFPEFLFRTDANGCYVRMDHPVRDALTPNSGETTLEAHCLGSGDLKLVIRGGPFNGACQLYRMAMHRTRYPVSFMASIPKPYRATFRAVSGDAV